LGDKLAILAIKAERITDAAKLRNVRSELDQLRAVWDGRGARPAAVEALARELKKTNESLWAIEDDIRECERQRDFGPQFVELARAVYRTNDRRAEIKRDINLSAGSNIIEEKSYRDYQCEAVEHPGDAAQVSTPHGTDSQQGSATVLKDCRHGRMLFLKRDKYIGRSLDIYGEFSELEARVFTQLLRANDVVIEAGANIGAHTVHIANLVGAHGLVLAFEPQGAIYELLCANIALNELFHVRPYHGALGRDPGTIKVPVLDYGSESNFGGLSLSDSSAGEDVPLFALDSFALPALRMLKVDVEGMEAEVLSGARETIGRLRPILYVENDRRAQSERLIKLIDELGYDMWWHLPPLFNPGNFAQTCQNIFGGIVSRNLLCFPKEKSAKVSGLRPVTGPQDWELMQSTQTPEIIFSEAPPSTKPTT
jgi:FkbM family methyltransferase